MLKKHLLLLSLLVTSISFFGQKDSIKLSNGNILIGEIKSLDKSVMTFKTSYSDKDFKIKWYKVDEIYSDRIFIISLTDGVRIESNLESLPSDKSKVMLHEGQQTFNVNISDIIFLDAIGSSFISRMTASFDAGVTITKTNNLKQFTANAALGYVANKWSSAGSFNLVKSRQDSIADVQRMNGNISAQWFLPKDWFIQGTADFLSNNEQKLKLRSTTSIGLGYFFKHTNSLYFGAAAGLAFNNESYTDATINGKNSMEFYVGTEFNKYAIGDLSLITSIIIYPGITERGRIRSDFNFDMKYDLPYDFYIKTGITYNYDNQPVEGASQSDYTLQTSFGWELKL